MKNKNSVLKVLRHSTLLVLTLALLSSCSGVIFDTIREEVKLSDAQISGDVQALTRHAMADDREFLFAALGKIWKKDIDTATTSGEGTDTNSTTYTGNWVQSTKPANLITGITSSYNSVTAKSELYVMTLDWKSVDDDGENKPKSWTIYYSDDDGETWKKATYAKDGTEVTEDGTEVTESSTSYSQKFCVFGTNTPQKAHRAAFANLDGTIYRLTDGKATKITADATYNFTSLTDTTSDIYKTAVSVVTFDGASFYFSSNSAMTSNESRTANATHIYAASGSTIYYRAQADSSWTSKKLLSDSIYSMASTTRGLLCGTEDGLQMIETNESSEPEKAGSVAANASSTLSSYYEVRNVLAIDPSKSDTATDIYASTDFNGTSSSTSATFQNVGLWAYYPGRNKWNRE